MVKEDARIPVNRIGALNTFLFREGPWNNTGNGKFIVYEYDLASVYTMRPEALFLVHALTTLKGTCSSLPMLWAVIADRLGWPVKVVRMPGHIFLRYEGAKHANIDPSAYGGFVPDTQYIKDFKVSASAIKNGVYMRSLSKKEFISTMLVNNAFYSMQVQKDTARAVQYLQIAIAADSSNADAYSNLALIRNDAKLLNKAKSLGFSRGYSETFLRKQQESVNKQKKGVKPL
jgi:regulator of sirC expression with transglutaminase-like and TPR domain